MTTTLGFSRRSRLVVVLLAVAAMVGASLLGVGARNASAASSSCSPFPDVSSSYVHCDNIEWLKDQSITKPLDGLYHPLDSVSRGAMAAFLFRLSLPGVPEPACSGRPFPDVATDSLFCGYIQWAQDNGLASGYPNGTFGPGKSVTRGAMVAFLFRLSRPGEVEPACSGRPFPDVATGSLFCGYIQWAHDNDLASGYPNGTFGPARSVTRGAMASFLHRLAMLLPSGGTSANAPRNITHVVHQIEEYYGSKTVPIGTTADNGSCPVNIEGDCVTTEIVPSSDSDYATQMKQIERRAKSTLEHYLADHHGTHPALVFDIDDTVLNTYNYERAMSFAYTPKSNASWVDAAAFPATPGMPTFVNWAHGHGFAIFFITGRPHAQLAATQRNLTKIGYTTEPLGTKYVYLKHKPGASAYLPCASTSDGCSTIQYKSGTRRHIEDMGYDIVGNFGDQFSDLKGGHAAHRFKLPNPMYYLP